MCEITREAYMALIKSDDRIADTIIKDLYMDIIYHKHGMRIVHRVQSSATQYYIVDINR